MRRMIGIGGKIEVIDKSGNKKKGIVKNIGIPLISMSSGKTSSGVEHTGLEGGGYQLYITMEENNKVKSFRVPDNKLEFNGDTFILDLNEKITTVHIRLLPLSSTPWWW